MVVEPEIVEATETAVMGPRTGLTIPRLDDSAGTVVRYLWTMSATMAVLFVLPFLLVRSGVYDSINPSFYARPLNFAFNTAGQNADVVLFGDSTALLGIDPSQMSSALGVKVLNLVNTQPSLVVNDDLTLRRYLASNRPPRLVVFYFAPWDFDYGHTDFDARPTYEGQELLLRQGTRNELSTFIRRRPMEALEFPLKFYATALQLTLHRVSHPHQYEQLAATHGHLDNTDPTVLSNSCSFPPFLVDNVHFAWVRSMAKRYATPETRTFFYVAPVPACANAQAVLSRPYDRLPAAPPVQVPPQFFSNDIRYIHPRPFAVPQLTRNLTDAVRPLLADSGPPSQISAIRK